METAHPLRDMSAEFSTIDDADTGVVPPAASLKLKLPRCPPGRADTDVKRWYRTTVETLKANRLFHILRLCGIELKDMDNKEFSDNAVVKMTI